MATTNQTAFSRDIRAWAEKLTIRATTLQKKITFDLHKEIVERTPVDTGRARANWFVTVGAPSERVDAYEGLKSGAALQAPPPDDIKVDGTEPTFIINNLPYIKALDEGHSQQAPNGMVQLAMKAEDAKLQTALREAEQAP